MRTRKRGGVRTETLLKKSGLLSTVGRHIPITKRQPRNEAGNPRISQRIRSIQHQTDVHQLSKLTSTRQSAISRHTGYKKGIISQFTLAQSPELLHAIVSRMAHLPSQPLLQIVPAASAKDDMGFTDTTVTFVQDDISDEVSMNAKVADIPVKSSKSETSMILAEIQNPTNLVHAVNEEEDPVNVSVTVQIKSLKIHNNLVYAVKEDYSTTEKLEVPIYIVVISPSVGHMSLMVLYKTAIYSLGFGFLGQKNNRVPSWVFGKGAFYSPDYLIHPSEILEKDSGDLGIYKYQIVDIGYLKPIHLQRIAELASKHSTEIVAKFNDTFRGNYIPLENISYHMVSTTHSVCTQMDNLNCTTFITYVFREKVNCSYGGLLVLPVNPTKCRRIKGKLPSNSIKRWYDEYINNAPTYSAAITSLLS